MAITDVIGRFLKKETSEETNYLSLTLTPDRVLATIWDLEEQKVEVLGFARKSYQNVNSIIHQSAEAIDAAAQKAKSDVSQTVFGLSHSWFDGTKIKKETASLIKKLSQELELDPQAFVPLASSIKNYLRIESGITPHAVLVGIFSDSLEAHLIKNNEVEKSHDMQGKPTIEKISSLIKQLGDEKDLPAKIIVFGIPLDSRLAEDLEKHEWRGTFIHKPRVEFLKNREVSKSVAFAQAADVLGHELSQVPTAAVTGSSYQKEETAAAGQEQAQVDEFGFIAGEDVLSDAKSTSDQSLDTDDFEKEEDSAVAVDQDVINTAPAAAEHHFKTKQKGKLIESIATLGWFTKLLNIFKGPGIAKKISIGIVALILLGLIGTFIAGKTITSAEVIIKVNAKSQEESLDIDVIKGASLDFSKGQIGAEEVSTNVSGSRKAVVAGTKEVGEPAKGEVTVFNWTTSQTSFPPKTVVISKNGVKFELDQEISVASRSASTPGQAKTKVTAIDLGTEGNVGAGTDFTFQEFDDLLYSGTSDNAFSGGDKKEVTVVSQEDMDKLEESLVESLKENATRDLKAKLSGKTFSENGIEVAVVKKVFDKKLDEEASLVNLDLEVEATAIAYNEDDLKKLLAESVKEKAPENLEAKAEDIKILSTDSTSTARGLNLSVNFEAKFVPKFDENDLKEKIAGKSVKQTREVIKDLPEVLDVNVNFSPSFLFSTSLPTNKEKIKFKIET